MALQPIKSPNFSFLAKHDAVLVRYAAQAERYVFEDPNAALFKLRQFAEHLTKLSAAYTGTANSNQDSFNDILQMT